MVNSKDDSDITLFDHKKFNELVFEFEKMGQPFIVVMRDLNTDKVHSMGNFDDYINGLAMMADTLHDVANALTKIDETENPPNAKSD